MAPPFLLLSASAGAHACCHSVLPQARSILVTNWPMAGVPQLMESFSLFTPADSKVTFILPEEAPATWPSRLGNCRFSFTTAENPTGIKVCESWH